MLDSYPEYYARYNTNFRIYSEIVISHFTMVKEKYAELENNKFIVSLPYSHEEFEKNCMITIVFSAMALESFFNDYAASCLGDSLFYGTLDKLSIVEKFELIVSIILKNNLDKSNSLYYKMKKLVKDRNDLIHNKSHQYKDSTNFDDLDTIVNGEFLDVKKSAKNIYLSSFNAKTILDDVSSFFDKIDSNSFSTFRLLGK